MNQEYSVKTFSETQSGIQHGDFHNIKFTTAISDFFRF